MSEKLYRTQIVVWTREDPREQGWDLLDFYEAERDGTALITENVTTLESPTDKVTPEMLDE
jgi:hypothetical protein